jgi:hypothetical protein
VVCQSPLCEVRSHLGRIVAFACQVCGDYKVEDTALQTNLNPSKDALTVIQRAVLSHRIREANDAGREPTTLTTYDVDDVIENGRLPTPAEQATNILRFFGDRVASSGEPVDEVPVHFHATIGSPNHDFAMRIVRQLISHGLLTGLECGNSDSPEEVMRVDLTLSGWTEYEREQRGQSSGNYGFIALQFGDPVLDPLVKNVVKPAVAALGFDLVDMRDAAEAGVIDNVMRARIRDAAFVLVDLTHANKGAYWEAGYAEGLGKPVLYLCSREVFDAEGTHFDIRLRPFPLPKS